MPLASTLAVAASLLAHVPPLTVLDSDVIELAQTVAVPPIVAGVAGNGFTVTTCVIVLLPQPLLIVYDIVAVPAITPDTLPLASTEAVVASLLAHEPPLTELDNTVNEPAHTVAVPPIDDGVAGNGFTVTLTVATAVIRHPVEVIV